MHFRLEPGLSGGVDGDEYRRRGGGVQEPVRGVWDCTVLLYWLVQYIRHVQPYFLLGVFQESVPTRFQLPL
ncbi:hypothetical protein LguiB_009028 [Lonicera macranthoides]